MKKLDTILNDLPDPESASRFLDRFSELHPREHRKLTADDAILADVLALASFSPLIAQTLLQSPEHVAWLRRRRSEAAVRDKDEMLESLARFSLTSSQLEPHVQLARFRRRELMRIFLRDIRRLATIAEITDEISTLADAILEHALRLARQDLDNRFGQPLATDTRGRDIPAEFCIVSLGKLGSRELNYASDIDLLFIYSADGTTSGSGSRGSVTNREYFVKLAERVIKLVGEASGEGSAYRVDLRLRPNGRVGPLALSLEETVRYYESTARPWERQVLIRSRSSAGDAQIYKEFSERLEPFVFVADQDVSEALHNVLLSKQSIDLEQILSRGFDVKLGRGGIREIEFIAQALQLAHGGRDEWIRSPHTLITLDRLHDRKHISDAELTSLTEAYAFLRHSEHILQMENGLQTHTVPNEPDKRLLLARKMRFDASAKFDAALAYHTGGVHSVFERVFSLHANPTSDDGTEFTVADIDGAVSSSEANTGHSSTTDTVKRIFSEFPRLAELAAPMQASRPQTVDLKESIREEAIVAAMASAASETDALRDQLANLRREWQRQITRIIYQDATGLLPMAESKRLQTILAESSIAAALKIAERQMAAKFPDALGELRPAILGLGKLGSGGLDLDSDLDLIVVYDSSGQPAQRGQSDLRIASAKLAEGFINALSGMTREGSLYRVDLRLRPFGKDGPLATPADAFADYFRREAATWELLAFVKLRGVGGDAELARVTEQKIREIIHVRGSELEPREFAAETRRIRLGLESERADRRTSRDIDIKYGEGGMLDIYFAIRFLQLRDNVPDEDGHRSTGQTLRRLLERGSLDQPLFETLLAGHDFLSRLDHELRLTVGRTTRLPNANKKTLEVIARRLELEGPSELSEHLTAHRLAIRAAFDQILG